jgi:hypothetical protein
MSSVSASTLDAVHVLMRQPICIALDDDSSQFTKHYFLNAASIQDKLKALDLLYDTLSTSQVCK